MTVWVNDSLREREDSKKKSNPVTRKKIKNRPLKVGGHNIQGKEEFTVLPQCVQKSGTSEVFGWANPHFLLKKWNLEHNKMWDLHYHG